jgi:hypothetical protein
MSVPIGTEQDRTPFPGLASHTTTFTIHDIDLDVVALMCGYRDWLTLCETIEPHILRGEN